MTVGYEKIKGRRMQETSTDKYTQIFKLYLTFIAGKIYVYRRQEREQWENRMMKSKIGIEYTDRK